MDMEGKACTMADSIYLAVELFQIIIFFNFLGVGDHDSPLSRGLNPEWRTGQTRRPGRIPHPGL